MYVMNICRKPILLLSYLYFKFIATSVKTLAGIKQVKSLNIPEYDV